MFLRPTPAAHSHRPALGAIVFAIVMVVAACSSDTKTSQGSPTSDSQSTTASEPDSTTTTTTTAGTSTTMSAVAASETTAPDVMRSPPIARTIPGSTLETVPETTTSVAPEPTTTSAPVITDPPTTEAGNGCVSCAPNFVFPYPSFFDVPQLGSEPVRGTGCGSDGTLGEVIPDGIWDAHSITISASTLNIDVQCVYYGKSGAQLYDNCLAEEGPDGCEDTDPDFWFVNASNRIRGIPLSPSFRRRYGTPTNDGCTDPGPGNDRSVQGQDDFDSWVIIEQGMATFALTSCVYG